MTTTAKTTRLLMNIPLTVQQAKYLDVVPGQYGAQLRVKGTIEGEADTMLYLPGKMWAVAKALKNAGIIAQDTQVPEEVERATAVEIAERAFVLTLEQVPGQKYANLSARVTGTSNGSAPTPTPRPAVKQATEATENGATPEDRVDALFRLYDRCLNRAMSHTAALEAKKIGDSPEAVSARAATLFIAAKERGL